MNRPVRTNFHIKIDAVAGSSEVAGFEGQIQVDSFAWGMSQETQFAASGGGGHAPRPQVQGLVFTHGVDNASPRLMIACCEATHFGEAVLTCCKAGGQVTLPYFKVLLRDVIVARVELTGEVADDTPVERVTLAFREYEVEYQAQSNDGGQKGGPLIVAFDVQQNRRTR